MSKASKPAYSKSLSALRSTPEYLSRDIAAELLGLSKRRVFELASIGKIRHKKAIDPDTNREQYVFLTADVERIASGEVSTSVKVPGRAANVPPARPQLALPPAEAAAPRLWMTAAEAEEYSGLPARFIVQLIETARLPALDVGVRPGGRWRIKRADIDDLRGSKQR